MNETLRRALMHARLSEDDVAAHLQVDPKTVRRWLEGRTPYLRHRWALSALLALDEADLWPQFSVVRPRPDEIRAIYPHSGHIPQELWRTFFRSARQEIGILPSSGHFPPDDPGLLSVLRDQTEAGVRVLICLRAPDSPEAEQAVSRVRDTLAQTNQSDQADKVEIRLHDITLPNSIYRADTELIIFQRAFGVPTNATPGMHLRHIDGTGLAATYLESFHHAWANSESIT